MTQQCFVPVGVAQAAYGMLLQLEDFALVDGRRQLSTAYCETHLMTGEPVEEERAELLKAVVEELRSLKGSAPAIQTELEVCRALLRHLSEPYGHCLPATSTWRN